MESNLASAESSGYNGPAVAGAAIATVFFPLIALIAALLLLSNEPDARKRSQLKAWAWVSGVWVVLAILLILLAVGVYGSHSGSGGISPVHG